ncbi:MAG: diguanylate cyclase, partial [Oceanisphaera sp.]|nr:diguanylate cyclase [Oceanisphaera sp.]
MPPDPSVMESKFALLKIRFADRTAAQLDAMGREVKQWQQAGGHCADITALYQLLHRLAGSSGTFGFVELGQQARSLEHRLTPLLKCPELSAAHIQSVIDADFLEQLQRLTGLLQQDDEPASLPAVISPTPPSLAEDATEVLILGAELADLVTPLGSYGFNIAHHVAVDDIPARYWHQNTTIITCAHHLKPAATWNTAQARRAQQKRAPIICIGADDDFDARYRLAELGASGLFTRPVEIPALAERIEQLNRAQQTRAARVLLLDDDKELAEHYRLVLTTAGINVRVMTRPAALLSTLAEFRPDIVLMDINMAPYSGVTLARMIRFEPQWLSLPIIYLSSEQDRDQQLSALAQGADEFITKPISDQRLIRTVRILYYRARQLSKLVSCDGLTGLLNHTHIKQALTHEFSRVQRLGHSTTVAMLDLDHFKRVNDNHGHAVGDQVIKALANLLHKRLRITDHLGRYGGEEFVAILPEC